MEYQDSKEYALRCLARKSYFSEELVVKLREKSVPNETIDRIIQEFKDKLFLNDTEWVENFIRNQSEKGRGPQQIIVKLRQKRVPSEIIAVYREQVQDSSSQRDNIKRLLVKKYRSRNLKDPRERQKVIASLLRKGFDFSEIKNILCDN